MMTLRATAIGLALASLGLTVQAQPPMPDADGKPPMAQGNGKGKKPAQQNVPLAGPNGVLEWLSDQSGLHVQSPFATNATVNIAILFGNDGKPLPLPQAIDALNEALKAKNFIVFRLRKSITVYPTDEKIPAHLFPRMNKEELADHGKTEPVEFAVQLNKLKAADFRKVAQRACSSLGEVRYLADNNQLLIRDQAANVRAIVKLVQDEEAKKK